METIDIAGVKLSVKDYYCVESGSDFQAIPGEEYLKKEQPLLWMYVNVTDKCNASCPFCVSAASSGNSGVVDPQKFRKALEIAAPHIYGLSFTGGEPMLFPDVLDELISIANEILSDDLEIDIVINGTNLEKLSALKMIDRITTVHISRHSADTEVNNCLMRRIGPSVEGICSFVRSLNDPGKVVLNCVLQRGGVETCDDMAEYLDFAINIGVQNSSFITMLRANPYCESNYIAASVLPLLNDDWCRQHNNLHPDAQFAVWNRHSDNEYCHCLSGSYMNREGHTRFYLRCPGNEASHDYCRQLVYTVDNRIQDGFGIDRRTIISNSMIVINSMLSS